MCTRRGTPPSLKSKNPNFNSFIQFVVRQSRAEQSRAERDRRPTTARDRPTDGVDRVKANARERGVDRSINRSISIPIRSPAPRRSRTNDRTTERTGVVSFVARERGRGEDTKKKSQKNRRQTSSIAKDEYRRIEELMRMRLAVRVATPARARMSMSSWTRATTTTSHLADGRIPTTTTTKTRVDGFTTTTTTHASRGITITTHATTRRGDDDDEQGQGGRKQMKMSETLRVKKLSETATLPVRGSDGAAGYDLAR